MKNKIMHMVVIGIVFPLTALSDTANGECSMK